MRIECYYYEGCGSLETLPARLEEALALVGAHAHVHHRTLSPEEGLSLGIPGSPTVRIDGEDILPAVGSGGT